MCAFTETQPETQALTPILTRQPLTAPPPPIHTHTHTARMHQPLHPLFTLAFCTSTLQRCISAVRRDGVRQHTNTRKIKGEKEPPRPAVHFLYGITGEYINALPSARTIHTHTQRDTQARC